MSTWFLSISVRPLSNTWTVRRQTGGWSPLLGEDNVPDTRRFLRSIQARVCRWPGLLLTVTRMLLTPRPLRPVPRLARSLDLNATVSFLSLSLLPQPILFTFYNLNLFIKFLPYSSKNIRLLWLVSCGLQRTKLTIDNCLVLVSCFLHGKKHTNAWFNATYNYLIFILSVLLGHY